MILVLANPSKKDLRISNYLVYVAKLVRIILVFQKKKKNIVTNSFGLGKLKEIQF